MLHHPDKFALTGLNGRPAPALVTLDHASHRLSGFFFVSSW
jgi:hypothetical protein